MATPTATPARCCPPRYREVQHVLETGSLWFGVALGVVVAVGCVGFAATLSPGLAVVLLAVLLTVVAGGVVVASLQSMVIEVHDTDLRVHHTGPRMPAPAVVPLALVQGVALRPKGSAGAFPPSTMHRTRRVGVKVRGFLALEVQGIGEFQVGSRDPAAFRAALEAARAASAQKP